MNHRLLLSVWTALILTSCARAQGGLPPQLQGVEIEQRLNDLVPAEVSLRDEEGRPVLLSDYLQEGKPIILVLAYYRCPMLCTQVLNGLAETLRKLPLNVGTDFLILTVSFDARESSELARAKKAAYLESLVNQPNAERGWHFLTGEQADLDRLTQAVGFHYRYDPNLDQFAHASAIMVLTPEGRLSRYFYGIHFPPRDVRFALMEASHNRVGSVADRVLLFCYHYDPATGRYSLAALALVRMGGALTLTVLGVFFFRSWRRGRHNGDTNARRLQSLS